MCKQFIYLPLESLDSYYYLVDVPQYMTGNQIIPKIHVLSLYLFMGVFLSHTINN